MGHEVLVVAAQKRLTGTAHFYPGVRLLNRVKDLNKFYFLFDGARSVNSVIVPEDVRGCANVVCSPGLHMAILASTLAYPE